MNLYISIYVDYIGHTYVESEKCSCGSLLLWLVAFAHFQKGGIDKKGVGWFVKGRDKTPYEIMIPNPNIMETLGPVFFRAFFQHRSKEMILIVNCFCMLTNRRECLELYISWYHYQQLFKSLTCHEQDRNQWSLDFAERS